MARGSEWHSPPGAVEGEQRRSVAGQTPHVRWVAQAPGMIVDSEEAEATERPDIPMSVAHE